MTRQMTLWYDKDLALFEPLLSDHPRLDLTRVPGGSTSPPSFKLNSKTYGTLERVQLEYVRLSLPVRFHQMFVSGRDKAMAMEERRMNAENAAAAAHHGGHGGEATARVVGLFKIFFAFDTHSFEVSFKSFENRNKV